MDKGLTEERIAEIPNYEFSEVLTKREKLALKLAEKMHPWRPRLKSPRSNTMKSANS